MSVGRIIEIITEDYSMSSHCSSITCSENVNLLIALTIE